MTNVTDSDEDWEAMRQVLSHIAIGPVGSRDMTRAMAQDAMTLVVERRVSDVQAGAFLLAARLKRETTDELLGFLDALVASSHVTTVTAPDLASLADPYNGFTRVPHFAPVTAAVLAACGLPTYVHGGTNIPPKEGITARQIFDARDQTVVSGAGAEAVLAAGERLSERGVAFVDVEDFSPGLASLTQVRREIAKRPCLALLEKLITPLRGANRTHVVTGWVHEGYPQELNTLLRDLGAASATLVKGREGHVDPAVHRDTIVRGYDTSGTELDLLLRPKSYGLLISDAPDYGALTPASVGELWDEALHRKKRTIPGQTVRLLAGTVLTQTGRASTVMRGVGLAHQAIVSGEAREKLAAFSV